jgi:alpha-tubulin suppressor-like RCC1 family protein
MPSSKEHELLTRGSQPPGCGRWPWPRRLAAAAATVAAALAVPALPAAAAGAATASHGAAGAAARAASASAGTLRAWGFDNDGQLGDGTESTGEPVPVKVKLPTGTKVTQVRVGCSFSVALTTAGKVLAWGDNTFGQLGDGVTGGARTTPVRVHLPSGTKVTAVRAGCRHALALTSTGKVLAWGYNFFGQLGDGSTTDRNTPVFASMPAGVKVASISAGQYHSLALATTHTAVYSWGRNQFGQLGNATFTDSHSPVLVILGGVTVTALGATFGDSIAVISNGRVLVWGDNSFGELGDNLTLPKTTTPVFARTPAGTTVTSVVGGAFHILARTRSGRVFAWGLNNNGQLGDGTVTERDVPTLIPMPGGAAVSSVSAGNSHSLALTSKGAVLAWGLGLDGELGNGIFSSSMTPVRVKMPTSLAVTAIGSGPGASASMAIVHSR